MDRFRRSQLKRLVSDSKKKKSKTKLKDRNRNVALLTFDPVLDNNSIASDISSCQLSISPVQCFLNVSSIFFLFLSTENSSGLYILI